MLESLITQKDICKRELSAQTSAKIFKCERAKEFHNLISQWEIWCAHERVWKPWNRALRPSERDTVCYWGWSHLGWGVLDGKINGWWYGHGAQIVTWPAVNAVALSKGPARLLATQPKHFAFQVSVIFSVFPFKWIFSDSTANPLWGFSFICISF